MYKNLAHYIMYNDVYITHVYNKIMPMLKLGYNINFKRR